MSGTGEALLLRAEQNRLREQKFASASSSTRWR